jgi:hypothetical protein
MSQNKRSFFVLLILVLLVVVGGILLLLLQKTLFNKPPVSFDPPYPEFNLNGDPIQAVYEGRIPCVVPVETCEKIKIGLTLYHDPKTGIPTTFWLGYVGTLGNDRVIEQGEWSIKHGVPGYPEAEVIALDSNATLELRYYWQVNEDILLLLDNGLNPRVGDTAWGYMLSIYDEPYGPRIYE